MKVIDGSGAILGRLASYTAKELLKGEEISIVNCNEIIITGNKTTTEKEFKAKRSRIGHSLKGPKHHKTSEKMVKRAIRGMLPNFREGRGKQAFGRLRCYNEVPKNLESVEKISSKKDNPIKFARVKEFAK